MSEIQSILEELRRAATSGDTDAVEMWIGQLELPAMDEPKWPGDLFWALHARSTNGTLVDSYNRLDGSGS